MKPIIQIHDGVTGETVIREMTEEELSESQKTQEKSVEVRARILAQKLEKETNRQALLDRLGVTEEEVKILLENN